MPQTRIEIALVMLSAACSTLHDRGPAAEVAAIRAAREEQNQAIATHDVMRIPAYWTSDVTVRSGLGLPVSGRGEYLSRLAATGLIYVRTPAVIEVSPQWPLAFESGTWSAYLDGVETTRGRYSAQWVKQDVRWLIRSEVFVALTCHGVGCGVEVTP